MAGVQSTEYRRDRISTALINRHLFTISVSASLPNRFSRTGVSIGNMRGRSILALIMALSGGLLATNAEPQQQVFVLANDVSFTILPSSRSYKIGERIEFVYRIRNISHAALFVPSRVRRVECPAITPPYVWAGLEDISGKHYLPGYGGSCLVGPTKMGVRERMQKEAVLLKPGEVFQNSFQLETSMFVGKLMPGEYRLEATLYGWRDKDFNRDERAALSAFGHPFLISEVLSGLLSLYRGCAQNPTESQNALWPGCDSYGKVSSANRCHERVTSVTCLSSKAGRGRR